MLTDNKTVSSLRKAYGETLVRLGEENRNIVVLDADLACSTQTVQFQKAFPDRFFVHLLSLPQEEPGTR